MAGKGTLAGLFVILVSVSSYCRHLLGSGYVALGHEVDMKC
jgi:hypothetical protein